METLQQDGTVVAKQVMNNRAWMIQGQVLRFILNF